jgi:hypothetical protein
MTLREQRLARLRHERHVAAEWLRALLRERSHGQWFRAQAWMALADVRELDAKIASLTALTPFMRETVVRMCRQVHQGSTSALCSAVWDVEERVTA